MEHYLLKGPCEVIPEGALWLGLKQLLQEKKSKVLPVQKSKKVFIHIMAISVETLRMTKTLHTDAFQPSSECVRYQMNDMCRYN